MEKVFKEFYIIEYMVNWKKETARDILAFGSIVFYLLVIARALIKPYRPFVDQIVIAGIVLLIIFLLFRKFDSYISRGLIIVFFASLFYESGLFTIFASLVFIGMLFSSRYLKKSWNEIIYGLVIGAVCIAIGYYGMTLLGIFKN